MRTTRDNTAKVTRRPSGLFDVRFTDYRTGRRGWVGSWTRRGVRHVAWHKALKFISWNGKLEVVR